MKNSLTISMILIGLLMTGGCASNLSQSFSPDDAIIAPNVESAGTRVAVSRQSSADDELVTPNMRAAMMVVGLSEMSRMVDSARGQTN